MRILLITALSDLPEAHLICGLARSGLDVDLVADETAIYHDLWLQAGLKPTLMRFRNKFDRVVIGRLRSLLRQGRYDAFHAFSNRPLTNAMVASAGFTMGRIGYCGTTDHLHLLDPACRLTFLSSRMDRIVCVSDAVRRYMRSRAVPEQRLRVIYKGHDPSWYRAAPRAALATLGMRVDAFAIACVANLRPVKGGHVLLQALRRLPASSPVQVLLIGEMRDPSLLQAVEHDPVLRARVCVAGFRDDATSLLGACDATVMPSLHSEGLPKAVLESMCLGVPPIVSNAGGLPEVVESGRHGWVTPSGDAGALAEAMQAAAADRDSSTALGQAARARVMELFHISKTTEQTLNLYRELMEQRGRGKGWRQPS